MAAHEMDKAPNPPVDVAVAGRLAPVEPRRVVPAVPLPAPPALSATPDAASLLKALRRRWFLAGALGVLAAGLAFTATWYLLPPKFLASALLRIDSRQQTGLEQQNNRMDHSMAMKTSADRLKSREMLMKALNKEGVRNVRLIRKHPDAVSALMWIEENLKADYREGSELLNVTLGGEDPNDLVAIVGALTKAFLDTVNKEEKDQRKGRLDRYEKLLVEARSALSDKNAAKETLLRGQGAKDTQTLLQRQINARFRLQHAQDGMAQHQYELDKKNAKLAVLLKHKAELDKLEAPEISYKDILELDPGLKADQEKVAKLKNKLDYLESQGTPRSNFFYLQTEHDLAALKKQAEKRVAELRVEVTAKMRKKHEVDVDGAILELRTEITPLEGHLAKYQKDVEAFGKEAEEINFWTAKQNLLESEIQQQEKAVAELFQAVKRAEVEEQAEPRISAIGDAEWQPRDAKKRLMVLILAPLAALFGTVLAVSWWEFSARRIHGPDEVVAGLAMRVVGAVPELPDPRRLHLGGDPQAQEVYRHNLVESIDAIRTMLLRTAPAEDLRVVMVTSAVGGEGKTTLASNLAMSLARAGRKTLLIDCDLRRPSAHQLFEQTLQPGFSEVVLREVEPAAAVRPTTTDPNLYLLPAGHWDREVIQELAKAGLPALFARLRQDFDFIVVDSHPVLPATDSLLIGQHVDAVIVSLMRDVSQVHHVHAACQQLATLGIRVFGAVVNGVPVKDYGKGYQNTAHAAA
jgi:capsular exopolysaccharide synthesis family protein